MSDGDMAGDAADSNDGVGEVAKIKIRSTNGPKFCVHANLNSTVLSFKTIVAQKCEVPPPQQRLIHKGCIMKDDQTLRSYGLEGDHTVYLVRGSVPAAPAAGTTTNTAGNPELWREVTVRECLNALRQLTVSEAYAAGRMHRNLGALDIFVGNTMPFGRLFPELEVDSALDLTTNETNELMQDPEISQTMHNMLSNPQYLNQMLAFNPELQYVLHRQPWIRDAMQNPEFIRRLATPQIVLALLIYHRGLVFQAAREEGLTDEEKGFDTAAWGLEKLRNVFGEVATRAGIASAATASRPQGPEEQYATQLSQLQEMGFFDTQENIRALIATAGNVQAAVARLLGI